MGNPIVARSGAAQTAASALLSAADIWSTDNRVSMPAEIPQSKPDTTALAETADHLAEAPDNRAAEIAPAEIPEPKRAETIAPARTLRPSELLAETRFFSMIAKRVLDLTPTRSKSVEIKPAEIKAAEIKAAIQ